jgi:predicted alpha-1,2-mannosidase
MFIFKNPYFLRLRNNLFLVFNLSCTVLFAQSQFVNPFIGTAAHGHTFPGATTPFGLVQLSPDTDDQGWDWSSGYNYADSSIMGFSHTHLSGTGISDLADVLLMPYLGRIQLEAGKKDGSTEGYRSAFSHADETATAGYYSVFLKKHGIKAELTAAPTLGFHRYTFPKSDSANIIIDLLHGLDRHRSWLTERVLDSEIEIVDDSTIRGYRYSSGWANAQKLCFTIQFSKPFKRYGTALHDNYQEGVPYKRGRNCKAVVSFATEKDEQILMRVAIGKAPIYEFDRTVDNDLFYKFDFDNMVALAKARWDNVFKTIKIEGTTQQKTIFYTALYHASIAPNFNEYRDNPLRLYSKYSDKTYKHYSTLSLWDTYRAGFSLFNLIQTDVLKDNVMASLLSHFRENGYLPVWSLWSDEVNCMVGTPSVPVLAEAILKEWSSNRADAEFFYEAVKSALLKDNPVAPQTLFDKYGYVPNDLETFSVSKTLEMCYANWCGAQLALKLGKTEDYELFMNRSMKYKNVFDPSVGFFRGKDSKGNWTPNFDPSVTNEKDFVEATPWQYLFHVQHDIAGLIDLFGGKKQFSAKLDALFKEKNIKIDDHILDISGLIGQYAHGNEPSHHVAYLYNYVGESWKTQERVHQICKTLYSDKPDGLCGNEDCGQMSAWYIFSTLGFYPVNPSSTRYDIGAPLYEKAEIKLGDKVFMILAKGVSDKRKYVQSVKLNGVKLKEPLLNHADILRGGTLEFEMGEKANPNAFVF